MSMRHTYLYILHPYREINLRTSSQVYFLPTFQSCSFQVSDHLETQPMNQKTLIHLAIFPSEQNVRPCALPEVLPTVKISLHCYISGHLEIHRSASFRAHMHCGRKGVVMLHLSTLGWIMYITLSVNHALVFSSSYNQSLSTPHETTGTYLVEDSMIIMAVETIGRNMGSFAT